MDCLWLFVVPFTAVLVLIDAYQIGARKGLVKGLGDMGPWGWFFACLLLWIIAFPMYLFSRGEIKRAAGEAKNEAMMGTCPTCGKDVSLAAPQCPHCGQPLRVTAPSPQPAPPPRPVAKPPPLPVAKPVRAQFEIRCSGCKNVLLATMEMAGTECECPECGATIQVPKLVQG